MKIITDVKQEYEAKRDKDTFVLVKSELEIRSLKPLA